MNIALAFVNGRARSANALRWLWSHRTKALGTIGMAASYVIDHQDRLGLFVSAQHVTYALGIFGAAAFGIGIFNTMFPAQPRP